MSDIPEGLVEAVARAICIDEDGDPDDLMIESQGRARWESWARPARIAIQAHNAWLSDQDNRIKAFVEFRGPNPMDSVESSSGCVFNDLNVPRPPGLSDD